MRHLTRLKGFTLIELMAVIGIAAILIAIASPYMGGMSKNSLADRLYRDLELDFRYARSQAATLGKAVTFEPTVNWESGWKIKEGTTVLREKKLSLDNGTISSNDLSNSSPIVFSDKGYANKDADLVIKVNGCTGNRVRTISINRIGQIQLSGVASC